MDTPVLSGTPGMETTPPLQPPSHAKAVVRGVIIGLIILAAGAGGVFAYTQFSAPAPEKAMSEMTAHLSQITSYTYSTHVEARGQVKNPLMGMTGSDDAATVPTSIIEADVSGSADLQQAADGSVTIKVSMRPENDPDNRMTVGFDLMSLNHTTYVKLNQAPALGLMDAFIAPFKGQWIIFDTKKLKGDFAVGATEETSTKKDELGPEQIKQLQTAVLNARILVLQKKVGIENGLYHYTVALDKAAIPPLVEQVKKITGDDAPFTELQKDDLQNDVLSKINLTSGDVWLGKSDLLPRKIAFAFTYADPETKTNVSFQLTMTLTDYNKPITLTAPIGAKSIEDIMSSARGGSMGEDMMGATKAQDQKRLSDMRQVQTALELFYTDHNKYPVAKNLMTLGTGTAKCLDQSGFTATCGSNPYMRLVPSDSDGGGYLYQSMDGKTYKITTILEGDVNDLPAGPIEVTPMGIVAPK